MARNKKVEMLSNEQEVLHPMTDGDCVIFTDGQTLTQKLSEDDSVKYTPEIVNSSPMFKVGEGNTVDYSDNVLDGAYERATLQGQTYVNYIQESSADEITLPTPFTEYERTQHNTLTSDEEGTLGINLVGQSYVNALQHDSEEEYVVLGESLEFQEKKVEYTNEGQIKSAMLKGQTLVNLSPEKKRTITSTTDSYEWLNTQFSLTNYIQAGKTYLIKIRNYSSSNANFADTPNEVIFQKTGSSEQGKWFKDQIIYTVPSEFNPTLDTNSKILLRIHACIGTAIDNTVIADEIMVIEYQEGMENWDIPYFEGMQSVTVSTRLENKLGTFSGTASTSKTGKTFTTTDGVSRSLYLYSTSNASTNPINLKPNTKYLLQFTISNLVLDGLASVSIVCSDSTLASGNCLFGEKTGVEISANGTYRAILTTTDLITTSSFVIKGYSGDWANSDSTLRSLTISNIMCIEYQNGMENWNLPYFEDYQVMKPVQVESVNKNLQPNGTYSTNSTNNVSYIAGSEGFIRINPTKRYRVSAGAEIKGCTMSWYDKGKNYIVGADTNGLYPVTNPNAYYARLHINIDTNYLNTIQVEESDSSTATSYVPHQSKTTYSWDEVILRKIGDVEDTLDLTTGEWVQRIGEINSNEMTITSISNGNNMVGGTDYCNALIINLPNAKNASSFELIKQELCIKSDKKTCLDKGDINWHLPSSVGKIVKQTSINLKEEFWVIVPTDIATSELGINYLKDNPFTVQYVLERPIVHKVNLSRPNLQVYDDITHVHTKCLDGTLIPNIYLPSDISYPAILEPSKTYNVCVNQTEVSEDNPLTVNVGGTSLALTDNRMTITTPTTLTTNTVSFTGKGNKIKESMLIKNSSLLTRDLPHFNGIGSVQLGKTIENLCSSKYIKGGGGVGQISESDNTIQVTITTKGSCVLEFPILTPLKNGKTYFCYAPLQGKWVVYSFVETYNNVKKYAKQPNSDVGITNPTHYIVNIDQKDNQYASFCMGSHGTREVGEVFNFTRPIICEYEPGMEDWDWESIGYFTGTKNIGNEFMKVQNKNLLTENFTCCTLNTDLDTWYITYHNELEIQGRSRAYSGFYKLKPGATYTVSSKDNTLNLAAHFGFPNKPMTYDSGWQRKQSFTFTNTENYEIMSVYVAKRDDSLWTGSAEIANLINIVQLEESSTATTYTAHKHNGLYITKDQPIALTWEQGNVNAGANTSWNDAIQNTISKRIRTNLITLKPNTSYRVSLGNKNYMWYLYAFDGNNVCPQQRSFNMKPDGFMQTDFIFTTTQQLYKIALVGRKVDDTPITPSEINHIRLEEVTDVVLRGIDNVHDELDITRGIYTQRIGEIVFNGNENVIWSNSNDGGALTDVTCFGVSYTSITLPLGVNNVAISNNFKHGYHRVNNEHFYYEQKESVWAICIFVENKKLDSSLSLDDAFKKYLSENPLKIQYVLQTPIIHKVHIGNKNETNKEITKPNDVFTLPTLYTEQTHIDLTNNGIMPKVQSRDYIAYPVSPMIDRTYTLQHNLTGGVSNLTVDLLGRTQSVSYQNHKSLVYSPETMDAVLHNELRISGKGKISKVMYIDGGYMDRDIPYFEGMKNAVNPIVKNVGKNLFDYDSYQFTYDGEYYMGTCRNLMGYNTPCYGKTVVISGRGYTDSTAKQPRLHIYYTDGTNEVVKYISSTDRNNPTEFRKITLKPVNYISIRYHTNGVIYLKDIYVGIENTSYEPYKENICYVDCGEIRLTRDMFEQGTVGASSVGSHYNSDKVDSDYRIRIKELIKLEIGEQYVFLGNNEKYRYSARFYDMDGNKVNHSTPYDLSWKGTTPFTILNDAPMCAFFIAKMDDTKITVDDVDTFDFQLVKVSEIKPLRSLPSGVCDEIDLETGKYVQRVGEIVLDGSRKEEYWIYTSNNQTFRIQVVDTVQIKDSLDDPLRDKILVSSDKLISRVYREDWNSGTFISLALANRIVFRIEGITTTSDFITYLKQNPITVQYELAEPIVKDIVIHNYPHSYEGGHVIIENGDPNTPIPAQLTYRAVTNRSGQIQQHTEQVEKQDREINELEMLILGNIHLSQTR